MQVVAGMEPERTNEFLQLLAQYASDPNCNRDAALAAVLGVSKRTAQMNHTHCTCCVPGLAHSSGACTVMGDPVICRRGGAETTEQTSLQWRCVWG